MDKTGEREGFFRGRFSSPARRVLPSVATTAGEPSFQDDIRPLFREGDRQAMTFALDLWSHEDVSGNADAVLSRLRDGSMPCDAPWAPERIQLFERWIEAGKPA